MVLKLSRFNNIYELNFSREDVSEFEKKIQANVAKLKCTRTGSTSFFCENNN